MKRDRIDLRVRTDQKELWEAEAKRLGLTLTELITRATEKFIRDNAYAVAQTLH
jgi:uncharacterized protein (DUF1778 family)